MFRERVPVVMETELSLRRRKFSSSARKDFLLPKVETEEPPYWDRVRRGGDADGVSVTIETVSERVHGGGVTHTTG